MYAVYSINYSSYDLMIYKVTPTIQEARDELSKAALNFMVYEEGKKKAKVIEGDIGQTDIKEGYFVHRADKTIDRLEVYHKQNKIDPSWLGTNITPIIEKVMFFSISEVPTNKSLINLS